MIFIGNQRAGGTQLAQHLLNDRENDHVTVYELRGFVSDTLHGAMKEAQAISLGTRCKQYLYSVSLNPPEAEVVHDDVLVAAADEIENRLNLAGQPRALIFHEKNGRRHAHCVWSRIDPQSMTAINLSHPKLELKSLSQQLYQQNNWQMPSGLVDPAQADALSYGRQEHEQAVRMGRDPKRLKATFRLCWETADSKTAFEHALRSAGYLLARGDRRGFVAVDQDGEVLSLSRWLGIKTGELKLRLGDPKSLSSIAQAQEIERKEQHTASLKEKLRSLKAEHTQTMQDLKAEVVTLKNQQRSEREQLAEVHDNRILDQARANAAAYREGILGLWDRVTGWHKWTKEKNNFAMAAVVERNEIERFELIQQQLGVRRYLQRRIKQSNNQYENAIAAVQRDLERDLGHRHGLNQNEEMDFEP